MACHHCKREIHPSDTIRFHKIFDADNEKKMKYVLGCFNCPNLKCGKCSRTLENTWVHQIDKSFICDECYHYHKFIRDDHLEKLYQFFSSEIKKSCLTSTELDLAIINAKQALLWAKEAPFEM